MTIQPAITNADTVTHLGEIAVFEIQGTSESMGYEFFASLCVTPCQLVYAVPHNLVSRA